MSEYETKEETYEQNSLFFSTDYEKLCPFTRKEGFLRYFKILLDEGIIKQDKCYRIINNIMELNIMDSYLKTSRHIDNFCATQQLNNLYIRNKNIEKEEDIIKKELGIEKKYLNDINIKDDFLEKIIKLKDYLYQFSTISAGISNALIFLDEKNDDEILIRKNYNPWKADWILSDNFLKKRKKIINEIRDYLDYRGEISDDEDTIIDYDDESQIEVKEDLKSININNEDEKEKEDIKPVNIFNKRDYQVRLDTSEGIRSEKSESIKFKKINDDQFKADETY